MDAYEKKTGGSVLALAHNGNLSNGEMFPIVEAFGKAIDREYAEQRAKWERLYEATQMKGDGEAHPFLSPNDEFADYETVGQRQPRRQRGEEEGDARIRIHPLGAQERPQARGEARREPLQVRPRRQQRRAHRPRLLRGGQFLRQDHAQRAQPRIA